MKKRKPVVRKCHATNRSGGRCGHAAIPGGNVCRFHGGASPQVIDAARRRLAELVLPSIEALYDVMKDSPKDRKAIVMAAREVLSRAGYPAATKLEVEEHDLRIVEEHAQAFARAIDRTFDRLGIPKDDPSVKATMRAALFAETGNGDAVDVPDVTPIPQEIAELLSRWWRGEGRRPLALAETSDVVDAEVAE